MSERAPYEKFPYEKRNFREFTARFRQSHDTGNLIGKPVGEAGRI